MGLEKIRQTVLTEANSEATRIVDGAHKSRVSFLRSQEEKAEQEFDRLYKSRVQAIEEEYNRRMVQINGAAGKQILDKRNTVLRTLFEKAKKEILAWPPETYAKVMQGIIEKAAGSYGGKIRVCVEEKSLFVRVLSKLNEGRGGAKITLDQNNSLPERGGFIFLSADFEVDKTLDMILEEIRHDLLPAIAAAMFPGK